MSTPETHDFALIFEKSRPGRIGCNPPICDVPEQPIEELLGGYERSEPAALPELSELEVVRHFTNLSHRTYGIDTGFYPLGSCTMKYNPRINEAAAANPAFTMMHPLQPVETAQGCLEVIHDLKTWMAEITGFDAATMQPPAGASGELLCLMMIRAYHESKGQGQRNIVLVPDSAHGTNPASAARAGYAVQAVRTNERGGCDIADLKAHLNENVAAMMLTNPNTLGLFEESILEIDALIHEAGAQVFCDGANMNAMVGMTRPGDQGFDCMHLNLHKTFSTPHGGGGPGCGCVAVKSHLEPFLPVPIVEKAGDKFALNFQRPNSVGRVHSFYGNFLMNVRAWAYVRAYGREHLADIARHAVLNANYVRTRIETEYPMPFPDRVSMHEAVLSANSLKKETGIRALDISKRLIDYGFHPPTNYFPLIVPEALMIEPTETETIETLEAFCDAMLAIAEEARTDPDLLHNAPSTQPVGRLDEAFAAKTLDVAWNVEQLAPATP
ncbi:MAG TPA: aminomethyl-transferring glycine dehydrogenase subunit GcvPB [Fimbriimonadales bacterium]|nr:aminomethyl-transferring glycine dehydrogenase subunit GcvPB [Fimbriimonadales bacterium]